MAKSKPVRQLAARVMPDQTDIERAYRMDDMELIDLAQLVSSCPAAAQIHDWIVNAGRLGLDPRSPDVLRRCIRLGTEDFEHLESVGGRVASYRALRVAHRSGPAHPPVVYYMRQGDLVKIGTTTVIGSRAAAIGAQGVMAVEPGDSVLEGRRHAEFAADRSHLEYFRLSDKLAAHIVDVRSRFEAEAGMTTEEWLASRRARIGTVNDAA